MKMKNRPAPPLPAAALPANDNTTSMVIRLLETMPLSDRAALDPFLLADQAARMQAATLDEIIDRLPAGVLRSARDRRLTDALLRLKELDERDFYYREVAARLPAQPSGYAMAQEIRGLMRRYRDAGSWRFDRARAAPADPIKHLIYLIFALDHDDNGVGIIRSRSVIERALAGTRSKSPQWTNESREGAYFREARREIGPKS